MIWHLNAGAQGKLPDTMHTGAAWSAADNVRVNRGWDLGFYVATLQFRGDWAEFSIVKVI